MTSTVYLQVHWSRRRGELHTLALLEALLARACRELAVDARRVVLFEAQRVEELHGRRRRVMACCRVVTL